MSNGNTAFNNNSNSNRNYYANHICELCGERGHRLEFCRKFQNGQQMREKLKTINRCDACLVAASMHGDSCSTVRRACRHCGSTGHYTSTCALIHPGSWVLRQRQSVPPVPLKVIDRA